MESNFSAAGKFHFLKAVPWATGGRVRFLREGVEAPREACYYFDDHDAAENSAFFEATLRLV